MSPFEMQAGHMDNDFGARVLAQVMARAAARD